MKNQYTGLPFEAKIISPQLEIRKFSRNVAAEEMKWHRDAEDRVFRKLSGDGWLFQLDNKLPVPIEEGKTYKIPAGVWHRAIKTPDASTLVIELHKSVTRLNNGYN